MNHTDKKNLVVGVAGSLLAAGIVAVLSILSSFPPISVPLWVVAAIIGGPLVWLFVSPKTSKKQIICIDRHFSCETAVLENTRFIGCTFDRCILEYSGGAVPHFERCNFVFPTFKFIGPALNTAAVLKNIIDTPLFPTATDEFFPSVAEKMKNSEQAAPHNGA